MSSKPRVGYICIYLSGCIPSNLRNIKNNNMRKILILATLLILSSFCGLSQSQSFRVADTTFLLNSKPYVIRCGEMHFARIPKPYWKHRLQVAKAMGLNTV